MSTRPGEAPAPIKIEGGEARRTVRQVKEYLLCNGCEQRFGVHDNYVSALAYKDGRFPALSAVGRTLASDGASRIVEPGSLDSLRLAYFACSIVWRGHEAASVPRCDLGSTVAETLRAYLNDERPFPPNLSVTLSLLADHSSRKAQLGEIISMPFSMVKQGCDSHEFAICGMYFTVGMGSCADVGGSLTSSAPLVALIERTTFKEWLGPDLTNFTFIGRKPPRPTRDTG